MKLGDLWIKLGLKKDEFSKGLKEAGEEISGSGGNGGLRGKIKSLSASAAVAFAAIATAAVAMANKFAHTSQRLGDQWDQVTAGLKASWQAFVSSVNSTDFSNLGQKLKDAFQNAREIAASKDAEFEVMNSIELQKAKMDADLEALRVAMQNQKLTQAERIAAAEEYLRKIKPIYEQEERYRREHAEKVQNAYLANAGLGGGTFNKQRLQTFLTQIAPDTSMVEALDAYARNGFSSNMLPEWVGKQINEVMSRYADGNGAALEALAKIARYYQSTSDADAKAVVDAITAAQYAAGAFDKETRRIQNISNQAITGSSSGAGGKSQVDVLLEEALSYSDDVLRESMAQLDREVKAIMGESVEVEPLEIVPPDMTAWNEWYAEFKAQQKDIEEVCREFQEAVSAGFSDSAQEMMDQFAGLEQVNPGRIVQALLTPLANMAIKEGEILIATGVGVEAVKEALESLNGPAAIAAGAALIMIGAAAKSGLAALAQSGGKATYSSTYSGSAGSAGTQQFQTEMTVYVKGTIRGSDIVLSGQKTVNNWGR